MDFLTFSGALEWVITHSYFFVFLAMLVEGPLVTAAASFAAALGYFNIYVILIISFFGDFIGDIIHYALGYWGRHGIVERYGNFFGLPERRRRQFELYFMRHVVKGLVISKAFPIFPTIALLIAGAIRMPLRKFLIVVGATIVPRTILFASLGFYFGRTFETIAEYLKNIQYALLVVLGMAILLYILYRKVALRIAKQLEEPHDTPL